MIDTSKRILTTHVGSLPGPPDVWNKPDVAPARLAEAVAEVVRQQRGAGIDIVNEGELTKVGSWTTFMRRRLGGLELVEGPVPENVIFKDPTQSADWIEFAEFYSAASAKGTLFEQTGTVPASSEEIDNRPLTCIGPIIYTGQRLIELEIDSLKAGLGDAGTDYAFLTTVAPASFEPSIGNAYYESEEAFLFAIADALAVEYEAIAAAGLTVQVDDACLPALWEILGARIGLESFRKFVSLRLEALNHALRNIPTEQVRYHLCWGSWHGPHAHDLPLKDIVDLLLRVDAGAYLVESANVRHEHEWRVWEEVKLPPGKLLMPGVVSHATTLIEHPELVSDRLVRFARILGPENIVASTDCGLGARCHPQIAWAKLRSLAEGATMASKRLFG